MLWENVRIALRSLRVNRLRSLLATLGIVIGVAAVIAVVTIVNGFSYVITDVIQSWGSNSIYVVPFLPRGEEGKKITKVELTWEDGKQLMAQIPEVREIAPQVIGGAQIKHKEETANTQVVGTTPIYQEITSYFVGRGRFFSPIDERHRKKVCVVGKDVLKNLDIRGNPIGEEIFVNGQVFEIIGEMEERGRLLGQAQDDLLLVPYSTAVQMFGPASENMVILIVRTWEAEQVERAADRIEEVLRRLHSLRSDQPNNFQVVTQKQILDQFKTISTATTLVVGGIALIALIVGGIGIMNIMLVSVTERTREIGLRKALGARRVTILHQFLLEAVTLSLVGGLIGVALGAGIGAGVTAILPGDPKPHIPLWAVLTGFAVSAGVGIVMGFYPAARASRLDPVEALRYE